MLNAGGTASRAPQRADRGSRRRDCTRAGAHANIRTDHHPTGPLAGIPVDTLVTTQWLAANLGATELRVMDASFKMPGITPTAAESYCGRHIPGAVFFDIDRIADRDSHLPHMLPTAETFAREVGALGIGSNHRVVLYDQSGLAGAARAWWMFRVFGHERVAILDGGLRAWLAAGLPVDSTRVTPVPARFA
ncbi:MAG: hypothetical protein DIU71_03685, partial [Proteobacteria bacterium]